MILLGECSSSILAKIGVIMTDGGECDDQGMSEKDDRGAGEG